MIFPQNHSKLILYTLQSEHPFLINYWTVNINWYLERNWDWHLYWHLNLLLYNFLYNFLHRVIDINRLIYVNWFVQIDRFLYFYVNRLLNDLRRASDFDLDRNFLLNFNDLLDNTLWSLDIFWYLNPHLYRFLYNDLFYCLFRYPPILSF